MRYTTAGLMAIIGTVVFTPLEGASAAEIQWRLENPFRLFLDPQDTELHRQTYLALDEEERANPVLAVERRLAARFANGWAAQIYQKTCWNPRTHSYKACDRLKAGYIEPRFHPIVARLANASKADQAICQWRVIPARKGREMAKAALRLAAEQPCHRNVKLDIPYPHGGVLELRRGGERIARQKIKIKDIFIVGIGDSFASGEGNPDVPVKLSDTRTADYGIDPKGRHLAHYPTRAGNWREIGDVQFRRAHAGWLSRPCHRSLYSYQLRAALQLAIEQPQRAVTFVGFACAGSEITNGLFRRFKGTEWDRNRPKLSQISAVSDVICGSRKAVEKEYPTAYGQVGRFPELNELLLLKCYKPARKIDLLMVSIGGNDVGFTRILANAVLSEQSLLRQVGDWAGVFARKRELTARLKRIEHAYAATRKAAHYLFQIPWRQADRVLITAYPSISFQADGRTPCQGTAGMEVYPAFSAAKARLSEGEAFGNELYRLMQRIARRYHWTLVDSHREQFRSHGYCAIDPAKPKDMAEELGFPQWDGKMWKPFKPTDFRPYASRQRWFRTPNDAYLTVHFHAEGPIARKILSYKRTRWAQVVLAATYSGAFHPTAEGHAVIADAVVKKARQILAKYQ